MLRIRIGPSFTLATALAFGHALAAVCLVFSLPPVAALSGVAVVAASAWHYVRLDALRAATGSIVELLLREGGGCELLTRGGTALAGQVLGSTFVSPWLIVINIRLESGRRRALVLAGDCVGAEPLRQLRVWLRYRCAGTPPESTAL